VSALEARDCARDPLHLALESLELIATSDFDRLNMLDCSFELGDPALVSHGGTDNGSQDDYRLNYKTNDELSCHR
jgi:hypothetical protein